MNLRTFCEGISLQPFETDLVMEMDKTEREYGIMRKLFKEDRELFFQQILEEEHPEKQFLYYYCKMACETWEFYQEQGISEEIFFDTFSDIAVWSGNYREKMGKTGLMEYGWLWRHVEMTIFRLGRLQFEKTPSEWEFDWHGRRVKKGEPLISVHIPQGEPLDIGKSMESFESAFAFWGRDLPYVCHSWLLGNELKEFMKEESNIMQFQKFFEIVSADYVFREGEERIFKCLSDDPQIYQENTSLQKAAKKHLLNGGRLSSGLGILRL